MRKFRGKLIQLLYFATDCVKELQLILVNRLFRVGIPLIGHGREAEEAIGHVHAGHFEDVEPEKRLVR